MNVAGTSILEFNFVAVVLDVHRVVFTKHYFSYECLNSMLEESSSKKYMVTNKLMKGGINIILEEI